MGQTSVPPPLVALRAHPATACHQPVEAPSAAVHGQVVPAPGGHGVAACPSFQGLPYKHLITHHQEPSHHHLISTYDDHYNRHNYNPDLPPRRSWDRHKLLWLPERTDFPLLGTFIIRGPPTTALGCKGSTSAQGSWGTAFA